MIIAIFPLSLFREFKSLNYICLAGFFVTIYITLVISLEPFLPDTSNFSLSKNLENLKLFDCSGMSFFNLEF